MTASMLEIAQGVLASQPFNEQVGARITAFGDGAAVLEIDIEDRHRQQFGLVHGGVLSYAADNALTFAAGTVLGTSVVTGGLTIHYLQGAREGVLRATGRVTHSDRRQAVCSVSVEEVAPDGATRLCAVGSGTVFNTARGSAATPDSGATAVARRLYDALAARDVAALQELLAPDFAGDVSRGMPLGVGGSVEGADAMIVGVWGKVFGELDTTPEPTELVPAGKNRVIVLGHYRGRARDTDRAHTAAFAHDLIIEGGQVRSLTQITDTERWHDALAPA